MPVFPRYDLPAQFEVISRVAARCDVPLPALRWNEPDGGPLGTPFFVMDQVDGRVPLDNPPYVFAGWLLEAAAADRARLQRASVAILARLHAIADPAAAFPGLRPPDGTDALRCHVDQQRAYYRWALAGDGIAVPIIERGLDWLDEHWPHDPRSRRAELGRRPDRQHHLPGLRARRRARLGDGRARPARAGRRLVHLPAPVLPGHRRVLRADGAARLPPPLERGAVLPGADRPPAAGPGLLPGLRRAAARDRDGADQAADDPLRRGRRSPPIPTTTSCTGRAWSKLLAGTYRWD